MTVRHPFGIVARERFGLASPPLCPRFCLRPEVRTMGTEFLKLFLVVSKVRT